MDVTLFRGLTRRDVFALTLNNIVGAGVYVPAALAAGAGSWSVGVLMLAIGCRHRRCAPSESPAATT
jgi:hypothetical protein